MTVRAVDDYAAIRARLVELQRERETLAAEGAPDTGRREQESPPRPNYRTGLSDGAAAPLRATRDDVRVTYGSKKNGPATRGAGPRRVLVRTFTVEGVNSRIIHNLARGPLR
jgi:hypothetical protein